jgi:hypothetical protein
MMTRTKSIESLAYKSLRQIMAKIDTPLRDLVITGAPQLGPALRNNPRALPAENLL